MAGTNQGIIDPPIDALLDRKRLSGEFDGYRGPVSLIDEDDDELSL